MTDEEPAAQIIVRLYQRFGYQPDKITTELFNELDIIGRARKVLYPLVRDRVQHIASRHARSQGPSDSPDPRDDRTADRARQRARGTATPQSQRRIPHVGDPRLRFLNCMVIIPAGSKLYGDFTIADHQARLKMHEGNLVGAARRMSGHSWAIGEISRCGTQTLREIAEARLLADLPDKEIVA